MEEGPGTRRLRDGSIVQVNLYCHLGLTFRASDSRASDLSTSGVLYRPVSHGLCCFFSLILNIYSGFPRVLGSFSMCWKIQRKYLSAIHVTSFLRFPLKQYFLDSEALYKYKVSFS